MPGSSRISPSPIGWCAEGGKDAALQASWRAEEFLAKGDLDGQRVWIAIVRAVEELQRDASADGEKVH